MAKCQLQVMNELPNPNCQIVFWNPWHGKQSFVSASFDAPFSLYRSWLFDAEVNSYVTTPPATESEIYTLCET